MLKKTVFKSVSRLAAFFCLFLCGVLWRKFYFCMYPYERAVHPWAPVMLGMVEGEDG